MGDFQGKLQYELELGIKEKVFIKDKEEIKKLKANINDLPVGVFHYENSDDFYRILNVVEENEDIEKLLLYKQVSYLKTIKNSMFFLAVVCALGLFGLVYFLIQFWGI